MKNARDISGKVHNTLQIHFLANRHKVQVWAYSDRQDFVEQKRNFSGKMLSGTWFSSYTRSGLVEAVDKKVMTKSHPDLCNSEAKISNNIEYNHEVGEF